MSHYDQLTPADRKLVAAEAEVDEKTVKGAEDGSRPVSRSTRQKIKQARERLGFGSAPDAIIGIVVPDPRNPFFVDLAESIRAQLEPLNYQLIAVPSGEYEQRERTNLQWLLSLRVDGVFYCQNPPFPASLRLLDEAKGVSVVLVDVAPRDDIEADAVSADNAAGINEAIAHLVLENNHETIGFLAGPEDNTAARARLEAFRESMDAHGAKLDERFVFPGDYLFESGKSAANKLAMYRRKGEPIPSAIVSANDLMAIGLITGLKSAGLRVPQDVSVVGFDNVDECEMITPELTSIDQHVNKIAERAVRFMSDRVNAATSPDNGRDMGTYGRHKLIQPSLDRRQSVACYDKREPDRTPKSEST